MSRSGAKPGWYTGSIFAMHPALGLVELRPASGGFSILAPARKFAALSHRRGTGVKFCIGYFGGVVAVQLLDAPRASTRVRAHEKDRAAAHG